MSENSKPNPTVDPEAHEPNESVTDPKNVDNHESRVDRIANKAAHKAARQEQEFDERNSTISK